MMNLERARKKSGRAEQGRFNRMRCTGLVCLCAGLLILLGSSPVQAASILYGVTFDNELISIDTSTGAGTLVGLLASNMLAFGLSDRGGTLYTFDQNADRVVQLDLSTGGTLATFDIGINTVGEGAIAFRNDGVGFLSRSAEFTGTLWNFDIMGLNSNLITDSLSPSMDGLDFNGSGTLYGLSQDLLDLYTLDPNTGATTLIGNTGIPSSLFAGITFDASGSLYAVAGSSLYSINLGSGTASLVGDTGFDRLSGVSAIVPEPGTALLMGLGLVGLGAVGKRK